MTVMTLKITELMVFFIILQMVCGYTFSFLQVQDVEDLSNLNMN